MVKSLKLKPSGENKPGVNLQFGQSFNLRLLIHYIGDMHQPLHTVARFNSDYPNGDQGGNFFRLEKMQNVTNLHALWDSIFLLYPELSLPLTPTDWEIMTSRVTKITHQFPESSITDIDTPFATWSFEGLEIGKDFVYENIEPHTIPNKVYIEEGTKIALKQIAKGGYRLANLLVQTLKQDQTDLFLA